MANLYFSLRGFSFKMRGWEGAIDIDLMDENCAILVGINAGGKTLAMKVLREFSNLLDKPSAKRKKYFERFARNSGVESISVNFSYGLIDTDGESKVGWITHDMPFISDNDIFLNDFLGFTKDWETPLDDEGNFQFQFHYDIRIMLETKVTIVDSETSTFDVVYERRHGLEASATILAVGVAGSEKQEDSELMSGKGEIYDQWTSIFTNEEELEGMSSFGPTGGTGDWEDDLRKRTGMSFDNAVSAGDFEHWDPIKAINFETQVPEMLEVSGAYRIDEQGILEIKQMEEYFTQTGKIGEIFGAAHKHLLEWTKARYLAVVGEGFADRVSEATPDIDFDPIEVLEAWAKKYVDDAFLVEYNGQGASEPPLDETGLPLHIPGGEIRNQRLPNILSEIEEDFPRWLALRRFEGLTGLDPHDYFSSGQRRILGMFSSLIALSPGSTVLIDEPEIPLHIDWQHNLISALSDGFPHLNFVFATHSVDVLMYHPEKVVEVPPSEEV